MADLVLGLAKSSVEGTISMAKTAMEEEEKVQKNLKRDLVLITDEFEMMQSFLGVAGKEGVANDMTTTLVRHVRKVAIEAEDCIVSVIHLDKSKWWYRLIPSFMPAGAPLANLNKVVADVEMLKTRIEAMGQRNNRYNCIVGDFGSKLADKQVQKNPADVVHKEAAYYVLAKLRDDAKMQSEGLNLTELIIQKSKDLLPPLVVSVWSSRGDLEMTTAIIKEAYENQKIECAWVRLQEPRNAPVLFEEMKTLEEELVDNFMERLGDNSYYLIVLEDLSEMGVWNEIREYLSTWTNRGCIIVHTLRFEIASLCAGHPRQVSELRRFPDGHSVFALYKEEDTKRFGRQRDLGRLFFEEAIKNRKVMSVWGIAGVGKSSMVKYWIGDKKFREDSSNRFKTYGWVNVSQPFSLWDLSLRLLLDLHSESLDLKYHGILEIEDPIKTCRELLGTYDCLIIIDGLQNREEWDSINDALLTEDSGSFIIVITNEKSVAAYCAERILFNVKSLEEEEAFDLFKNKVYRNERTEVIENGKHIVDSYFREITAKCGGLPSVIIAVADILKLIVVTSEGKNLERLEIQCMKLRGKFFDEVKKKTAALRNLFTWVDSYFLNCRDFLKPCIFYLSIFPPSHMIRRRRLVRRWTAEGYSRANKELTAEEMSEEVMSNLIELSMIHPLEVTASMASFGVRMPLCQVNGFFREYIVSVSKEEKLVFELKGHCKMNLERTGQHLAIQRDWDRDRNVFDGSIDVSRLRSLTVLGEWRPFFVSDKMRVLRVLDLEGTLGVKDKELEEMLQLLPPLLRFLSLRGCRDITRLPDYLGRLRQLQTLDVRNTSVVALPSSITKLHKLDYARGGPKVSCNIDMGTFEILPPLAPSSRQCTPSVYCLLSKARQCTSSMCCLLPKAFGHQPPDAYIAGGVEVPRGIGKLSALHTLGVVHINSGAAGEVILEDLKNLTQLHKLGVCGVNQGNNQKLFSAISCHAHLQSLSVHLDENNQAGSLDDVSILEHLVNLRSLKLYGLVGNSPKWIKRLMNLRKLKLQTDAKLPQGDIDVLGTLPRLQILCLWLKEFQYGKLQFGAGFSELFVLEITCNSSSTDVSFQGESTMQSLEVIKIRCCSVSHLQFTGLLDLLELAEVRLSGTYDCAFKQTLLSQLADHSEMPPVLKEWNADLKEWKTVDPEGH